jgi:hypothetical protein
MRTRKTVMVFISGLAGAGKTTMSYGLKKELECGDIAVVSHSLANSLKNIAMSYLHWDGKKDERGRQLLQNLGNTGRAYDIDLWCKHLLSFIENTFILPVNFVLVDDWRFLNEAEFFSRNPMYDVVGIRVHGRASLSGELAHDVTETSLPESLTGFYDYDLENSGSMEEFETQIREVAESLKKNYIVE